MVWYSHLFMNFSQFVVIHTVKGFRVVSEAEIDVFLELHCVLHDSTNVGNLMLVPLLLQNPACNQLEVLGSHTFEVYLEGF